MPGRGTVLLGGLAGLLAAAAAVLSSRGVAALLEGVTDPLLAVANRAVDAAPRPVKELAIETFGAADKPVLIGGVIGTVALLAVVAGALGVRRPAVAIGAFLVLTGLAAAAAVTDRAASAGLGLRLLPVLVLVVVGLVLLVTMLRALGAPVGALAGALSGDRAATGSATNGDRLSGGRPSGGRPSGGRPSGGRPSGGRPSRRTFLLAAAAAGGLAVAGAAVSRAYGGLAATASRAGIRLPRPVEPAPPVPAGVAVGVPGVTPHLTSNADFYRVDTALQVPDVPVDGWRLRVHGMVENELDLSFDDLLERGLVERRITLTCVSNPVGGDLMGNALWLGVPVHQLLAEAGVVDGADAVRSTSADDWTCGTPLAVLADPGRGALVAVGMNGEPLPVEHGFPARLVTPGLYGYVSATKWLVDLEVTRFADFTAYWTSRGYDAEAPIKTSSRIDVPRSFARVRPGTTPVAGVAWAQATGIARVEVRVDGGAWNEATLGAEDGLDTWRQWVWQWEATPGNHRLEVRATDADGRTQTGARAPIAPNGSTGWDSVTVLVT
ncbi:MAG: probable sulfite oxidase [uncultured Nocardioidaceae bacterium]|uniref:Probable sulfite oxidase n=1 Tax=uncultured Nocardioidaceae bacterium TaxID=253824 RepID=A0A6J4LN81_9ACTN|nr:MAG: probable sulfite oxidase [uncultured Nocardioidaceae bacterium]